MAQYNACMVCASSNHTKTLVLRKQLISTSYYALNNSNSKSIVIGIDIIEDKFEPVIKLISSKQKDLTIRCKTWEKLCGYFEQIDAYLNHCACRLEHRTPVEELIIVLKTSFGEPSLMIEQTQLLAGEPRNRVDTTTLQSNAGPLTSYLTNVTSGKASNNKPFIPGVVFQLTTFEGLKKSKICVDLRLQQLKGNLLAMQIVLDTLVLELQQRLVQANCKYGRRKISCCNFLSFKIYRSKYRRRVISKSIKFHSTGLLAQSKR